MIDRYVKHSYQVRLHSATGYITPADCMAGLSEEIHRERDRKLEDARIRRGQDAASPSLAEAG